MSETRKEVIQLRATPEMKKKLAEIAESESRTVSNLLELIIKDYLSKKDN